MTISPLPVTLPGDPWPHDCHLGLRYVTGLAAEPLKIDFLRRSARFTWNLLPKALFWSGNFARQFCPINGNNGGRTGFKKRAVHGGELDSTGLRKSWLHVVVDQKAT